MTDMTLKEEIEEHKTALELGRQLRRIIAFLKEHNADADLIESAEDALEGSRVWLHRDLLEEVE